MESNRQIGILDYGVGNLASIANMLKKIGCSPKFVRTISDLVEIEKMILPGVGAFDYGMRRLQDSGLIPGIEKKMMMGCPVLGICLGAQMLGRRSEEGRLPGLGWIPMDVVKFQASDKLRVPHMGWNVVTPKESCVLFRDRQDEMRFYFVHSYHMVCDDPAHIAGTTDYGGRFTSVISKAHIFGAQFHPEKSHRFGAAILKNFVAFSPC